MLGPGGYGPPLKRAERVAMASATTTPPQSSAPEPALGSKIVRFRSISYWLLLFAALKMAAAEAGSFSS